MRDCYGRAVRRARMRLLGARPAAGGGTRAQAPRATRRRWRSSPADSYNDTDAGHRRRRRQRQPAGGPGHRGAAGRPPAVQRRRQEGLHPRRAPARPARCRDRQAGRRRRARRASSRCASTTALRRSIEAALGGLTLLSPDPAKRFEAAQGRLQVEGRQRACHARCGDRPRRPTRACKRALQEARAAIVLGQAGRQGDRQDRRHHHPARPRRPGLRAALLAGVPADQSDSRAAQRSPRPSSPSTTGWPPGAWRRTSGTGCRSARCCCWPPSASPSPSA